MKRETKRQIEKEFGIKLNAKFDCGWRIPSDRGCDECRVCRYLNFREWAEGVAPTGSSIETNVTIERYLDRRDKVED